MGVPVPGARHEFDFHLFAWANRHQRLAQPRTSELHRQFQIPGGFRGDSATDACALAALVRVLLAVQAADFLQDLTYSPADLVTPSEDVYWRLPCEPDTRY